MNEIVIDNFQRGIGTSPYTGFAQMTNADIYSKPGSFKISNKLVPDANSASVVDELIKWQVQNPVNGDIYAVDRNGKLYHRDFGTDTWSVITGHGVSAANGEGLAIWKGYLFYARRFRLDVMEIATGTWTNDWQNLDSSFGYDLHPMMPAQDDILYIGNRQYVDTLEEVFAQTFDPGNAVTYTYNSQDLELRSDYRVTCLDEQGSEIIIGTLMGINGIINIADIFVWDGTSDSFKLNGTIHLVENGVQMMKNVNNIIYSLAGTGVPRIFAAITSQSQEVKRFNNVSVPFTKNLRLSPGAIEYIEGEILFGLGQMQGTNGPNPLGVYALRDGAYVLRYLISTGRDGSVDSLAVGSIKTLDSHRILVSWKDDANSPSYGVDVLTPNFYTGYASFVDSALYEVGGDDDPKTFESAQIRMGKALKAGDKIKLQARFDLDGTFTDILEIDTTAQPLYIGKSVIHEKVSNLGYFKNIQIRILLDADPNETDSPELMEVTLE